MSNNTGYTLNSTDPISWLKAARPVLENSRWALALDVQGVDVLDALLAALYVSLLRIARDTCTNGSADSTVKAHPSFVERIRQKYLGLVRRGRAFGQEQEARRLSQRPVYVPVLFWPREPTHVKVQIPVAAALGEMGIESNFLVCKPAITEQLRAQGIDPIFTRGAWPSRIRKARMAGRRMARTLTTDPGVSLPVFPQPWEPGRITGIIREPIRALLPAVHEAVAVTNAIVDRISPDVLVVGNDITLEGRAASLRARFSDLLTASIMHGSVIGPLHGFHLVDRMLVYGNNARCQLVRQGMKPSQIIVCGAPYLDTKPRQSGKIHPAIQARMGLSEERPWVLVATSGPGNSVSHSHHCAVIEHVMRLSAKLTDISFVAKLHRKDRIEYYEKAKQIIPQSKLRVVPYGATGFPDDIFDWLQGCSMVLTGASTVAMEAMLMDVPVITMDFAEEIKGVDFIDAGATIHVKSAEELENAILTIVQSQESVSELGVRSSGFIRESFHALDGKSARRCAKAIRDLL